MADLPGAVLFVCNHNAVRSPMAEGLLKQMAGSSIFVDSVGVRPLDAADPFMVAVMEEIGVDLSRHRPKSFEDIEDEAESYDLVVTLSPQAQHRALELTRYAAIEVELWMTFDPTGTDGSRETVLQAYRDVREHLRRRIVERFPLRPLSSA